MKTYHSIQAVLVLGMLFLGARGAGGELLPAGLQYRDKRIGGVSYASEAIVERLKKINAECTSRRLSPATEAYQFLGSLSGQVPLDADVIQQLIQMVDILDDAKVMTQSAAGTPVPTLKSYRTDAGDSLAATVLIESEATSEGLMKEALAKMTNEPQHQILEQTLKEIHSRQAIRKFWKKRMEQKRAKNRNF